MSLIHKALDQPALPGSGSGSDYNPLNRKRRVVSRFWWSITFVALLASVTLLILPGRDGRPPSNEPSAETAIAPAVENSEPESRAVSSSPELPEPGAPDRDRIATDHQPSVTVIEPSPNKREAAAPEPIPVEAEAPSNVSSMSPKTITTPAVEQPAQSAEKTPGAATAIQAPPGETATRSSVVETAPTNPTREATASSSTVTAAAPPSGTGAANAPAQTLSITRPDPQIRESEVQAALDRDRIEHAEILLQRWIREAPEDSMPRVWLAKIYLASQRFEAAYRLIANQTTLEAIGLRALILEKTGRYTEAATLFERMARAEPDHPQWWLHWAINLENAGRLAQARLLYQTYLEEFSAYNVGLTEFAGQRYRALEKY